MESPPKRVTRARAAAKASNEPALKTTKIVTAAAQAKASKVTATRSTAANKRKTRADDDGDAADEEAETTTKRPTRGRPRKTAVPDEPSSSSMTLAAKATRGRPAKKTTVDVPPEEPATVSKATRARTKRVVNLEHEPGFDDSEPEPMAKTTRARVAAAKPSTTTRAATKKSVKFQEPGKENMEPVTKAKETGTTSLRGRAAIRRGGSATAARSTRKNAVVSAAKGVSSADAKPLSPKKVTQMPVSREDESEDELAGDYTPVKPLMKSPVKMHGDSMSHGAKHHGLAAAEEDADSTINVNDAILNPPDFIATGMASPARRAPSSTMKDSLRSPARKVGAVPFPASAMKVSNVGAQSSPSKTSLLLSAAKRPPSPIKSLQPKPGHNSQPGNSTMKASLLQSPAKRSMPGFKPTSSSYRDDSTGLIASPTKIGIMATPSRPPAKRPSEKLLMEVENEDEDEDEDLFSAPIESISFPGRLSDVLPRVADPALDDVTEAAESEQDEAHLSPKSQDLASALPAETTDNPIEEDHVDFDIEDDDVMVLDENDMENTDEADKATDAESERGAHSPPQPPNPMFQLRDKDQQLCAEEDSDGENDHTSHSIVTIATPSFAKKGKGSRRSTLGFTSLSEKLGAWSASSPQKAIEEAAATEEGALPAAATDGSPMASHFFEEEMSIRPDADADAEEANPAEKPPTPEIDETAFDDVVFTDEDFALAQEANEMSLMEPEIHHGNASAQGHDDSLSDASQEYGDENEMPIDPAILGSNSQAPPVTPVRPTEMAFHNTTTKVPLKPEDNSTPSPLKKRSYSASHVSVRRPSGTLTRNATVISYSPSKGKRRSTAARESSASAAGPPAPVTPSKADMWSNMGTPARTPRRDLNPRLLQGAVVFVDVHTSEGADASGIFVELLSQMGARCLKSWGWNPSGPSSSDSSSNKVGITHVVYKDGGKRTMEKVRQSNGIVHCVGVSWVLDCERENEWLDEAPYYIDTSLVPRGGARRRKSMEPKALANMNGTLVDGSGKTDDARDVQVGGTSTPMNRRQSTLWMHTPPDQVDGEGEGAAEDDIEWSQFILTPVPKTPAPEAIARYAAEVPETPGNKDDSEVMYDDSPTKQILLMQTCPSKANAFRDLGAGILNRAKDEQVLMRLMAARRKSLQFAPKIGSPLAKTWH